MDFSHPLLPFFLPSDHTCMDTIMDIYIFMNFFHLRHLLHTTYTDYKSVFHGRNLLQQNLQNYESLKFRIESSLLFCHV